MCPSLTLTSTIFYWSYQSVFFQYDAIPFKVWPLPQARRVLMWSYVSIFFSAKHHLTWRSSINISNKPKWRFIGCRANIRVGGSNAAATARTCLEWWYDGVGKWMLITNLIFFFKKKKTLFFNGVGGIYVYSFVLSNKKYWMSLWYESNIIK